MPQLSPDGVPQYAEWNPAALDALFSQFKMLDPAKIGFDRSKLRTFYPYMGWNDLQKGLDALIASGRAETTTAYVSGQPLQVFVWKGA